ncbi:MAG: hypothetical protein OH340_01265, partial [Candidatus Parvarchaeota archaeon]|nr:hypothetical protein [Candidatus Rehaiarchaeum fermentans]
MMSNGAKLKAKRVESLSKKLGSVIVLGDLNDFDAYNIQLLRKEVKDKGLSFIFDNKVVIRRSLEKVSKDLADLVDECAQPFIISGNEVELAYFGQIISKYIRKKYVKAEEIAENDIVIPAGPTPFAPGPMTVKFSSLGIKTKNEGGKISVMQDTVVCKKGEKVKPEVASLLATLGIKAVSKNLKIVCVYYKGLIVKQDLLNVYSKISELVRESLSNSRNLSLALELIDKDTINYLIRKAYIVGENLMVIREVPSKENIGRILLSAVKAAERLDKNKNMDYVYA